MKRIIARLLIPIAVFTAPLLSRAQTATLLDDFEATSEGWRYVGGEEFPGARGQASIETRDARQGKGAYRLEADFTGGGKYVGLWRDLPPLPDGEDTEIRCWVKTRGISHFSVRMSDATGQFHQRTGLTMEKSDTWQEFVWKTADLVGGEHWGGANDGRWHGKPQGFGVNIMIENVSGVKQGMLWLDDVRVSVRTASEPTLLACAFSLPACRPAYGVTVTYRWDGLPMSGDNQVFVHVRAADGRTVFQADHDLPSDATDGAGPVVYDRTLVMPTDLPTGEYQLVAGLWNSKSGTRTTVKPGPGVVEAEPNGFLVGKFAVTLDAPIPQLADPSLNLEGYRVTFDEDFTDKLDVSAWGPGTRWIAHTPFDRDFGDAKFTNPRPDFPFTIQDGILRIEARKLFGQWHSGLLAAVDPRGRGFAQKFGYFEMRAKLPKGPGVWPAFWLMGQRGLTDKSITNIEIDVLEFYGANPHALCSTVHFWGPNNDHRSHGQTFIVPGMTDDFHRYGVLITEEFLIFYFDGCELWRTKTPDEAKVPVYPLLNLALGSGWPIDKTPNPSVMEVDYVRVWSR